MRHTQFGERLFGQSIVETWRKQLIQHVATQPPLGRFEEKIREQRTPEMVAEMLLDRALEETFRSILNTRRGKKRKSDVEQAAILSYRLANMKLVLRQPITSRAIVSGAVVNEGVYDGGVFIECDVVSPHDQRVLMARIQSTLVGHAFYQLKRSDTGLEVVVPNDEDEE